MPGKLVNDRPPKLFAPAPVGALEVDVHSVHRRQYLVEAKHVQTRKVPCDCRQGSVPPASVTTADGLAWITMERLLHAPDVERRATEEVATAIRAGEMLRRCL